MRALPTILLAGVASVAFAGAVAAQGLPTHVMNVQLPDGGVVQIEYTGNTAPRVAIAPGIPDMTAFPAAFRAPDPAFAQMERISALMDRQADAMLQQAAALMAQPFPATVGPNGVMRIDAAALPPGAQSYTFSETLGPNGVCRQSMAITPEAGGKPHVVTHQSGSCGGAQNSVAVPDRIPDTTPAWQAAGTLQVKAHHAAPSYRGPVMEAMYQPRD